jgi:Tfp pilus assembly protein PilF
MIMNTRLFSLLNLTVLLSGCCSSNSPQTQGQSPKTMAKQDATSKLLLARTEQSTAMVQQAKKDYQRGKLDSAKTLLEIATQTDPRNNEAWYWLDRVKTDMGEPPDTARFWRTPDAAHPAGP